MNALSTLRANLIGFGKKCQGFFYGPFFPVFAALTSSACYVANQPYIALFLFAFSAFIIFTCYKDVTPIIPLLLMVVMTFRDYSIMDKPWGYLALSPAMIGFLAHFILYPPKGYRLGKLTLPLIFVITAMFLSGIGSVNNQLGSYLAYAIALGPTILIVYLFFSMYVEPPKWFSLKKYLCYVFMIIGLNMMLHVMFSHANDKLIKDHLFYELGWANINTPATFMSFAVPAIFYLMTKSKNFAPYFLALVFLIAGLLLTSSRAALGLVGFSFPFLSFLAYKKMDKSQRKFFLSYLIFALLVLVALLIYFINIYKMDYIINYVKENVLDKDRLSLYKEAIELFKKFPFFGAGLGYASPDPNYAELTYLRSYNFHSTLFHVIATMGILGLLAYIFYFAQRIRILTSEPSTFNVFVLFIFIMFESHSMIDTGEFNAIPLMCALTVMIAVAENVSRLEKPLPLKNDD